MNLVIVKEVSSVVHINWNNIRLINNSLNEGFEEFVAQLARKETINKQKEFIRKGKPDAGLECLWILEDGTEWGWQAKYFISSLGPAQWTQIEESTKTAIEKHPKLKKYIIAIPLDPADAKIKGQTSLLDKWSKKKVAWEKLASEQGLELEIEAWWQSDIISRLEKPKMDGFINFWFDKEFLTDEWIKNQNDQALISLGERYSPAINYKLDTMKIFNGIAADHEIHEEISNQTFKLKDSLQRLVDDSSYLNDQYKGIFSEYFQAIKLQINFLKENKNKPFDKLKDIETRLHIDFEQNLNDIAERLTGELTKLVSSRSNNNEAHSKKIIDTQLEDLSKFMHGLQNVRLHLLSHNRNLKLINIPRILITGDAGSGKSHLLADLVKERQQKNQLSIFLLGQHFKTNSNPIKQIQENLDLQRSFDNFLEALSCKAQIQGSRILIIIDALNESADKSLWLDYLNGFVQKLSDYKWLGLVLTLRSTYRDRFQDNIETMFNSDLMIVEHEHQGFRSKAYIACKYFFQQYQIEVPSIPILDPEYENPLFLKLLCQGLKNKGLSTIPHGFNGIQSIFNFFIDSINEKIRKRIENYPDGGNPVRDAIKSFIEYIVKNKLESRNVLYGEACDLINSVIKKFNINVNLVDILIQEGLLIKDLPPGPNAEEFIYVAYERFSDHLIAEKILDSENPKILKQQFSEGGQWHHLVSDFFSFNEHTGIHEALAIQIPEKFNGTEFFELIESNDERLKVNIAEVFINTLIWRKKEPNINDNICHYINYHILEDKDLSYLFFEAIISVAAYPNYFFNANKTHEILMQQTLAERDSDWTLFLSRLYKSQGERNGETNNSIMRLIDWAWAVEDKSHLSDESMKLCLIMLAWFLVSPNRSLRDASTKAIVSLLEDRLHLTVTFLEKFLNVNDPYVLERVFASIYGAVLRSHKVDEEVRANLSKLSKFIYEHIFDQEYVYPHVLLRDYARGIIEFTISKGISLSIDLDKIRPPYKSKFPGIPSDDEINNLLNRDSPGIQKIFSSMEVDASRHGHFISYGDFGRYVFQSKFYDWKALNPIDLRNIAIKRIFQLGYDSELHGDFDLSRTSWSRKSHELERIGKKYQWIAMHELLAQVSDNYKKKARFSDNSNDEEDFSGPWEPFIRDIDPSTIFKFNKDQDSISFPKQNNDLIWETDDANWIDLEVSSEIDFSKIINQTDLSGQKWLVLKTYEFLKDDRSVDAKDLQKKIHYGINSFFLKKSQLNNFKGKISSNLRDLDFHLPKWKNYTVFSREYYYSPAYKYYTDKYSDHSYMMDDLEITPTTLNYFWEAEYDFSKTEARIDLYKPSKLLYDYFGLNYRHNESFMYSQDNEIKCFDIYEVNNELSNKFFFKKQSIDQFIDEKNLAITWVIQGEKQLICNKDILGNHKLKPFVYLLVYENKEFRGEEIKVS